MEQTEKFKRTFERFEKALKKFTEVIETPQLFDFLNEELIIEITIKRFEYTFESLWKTLKERFRMEGVICSTPLASFKEAFKAGLIDQKDEKIFFDMIEKRNQIVHIYDFEAAKKVCEFIKESGIFQALKRIHKKLLEVQ